MGKRLILREVNLSYEVPCQYLCEHAGFEMLTLLKQDETPIQSKGAWLKQGIRSWGQMLKQLGRIRQAEQLVLVGNYMSLFAVLLNKLHLVHPRQLYWWGFQIRGEKMQKLLKAAFKVLYSKNLRFILFSRYEKQLYTDRMGLKPDCFLSIPYGDWLNRPEKGCSAEQPQEPYYFTGGYSNRDYAGLLKAWEKIDSRLVVIGSKNNADLYAYSQHPTNPNVEVLMDTPSDVFDRYLAGARACILPFRSDSGAAGQTVALRCMKQGKIIVSSRITAMVEYTDHGRTGFLMDDMASELPGIIRTIEEQPGLIRKMLDQQNQLFSSTFAYDVITGKLLEIFER